MLWNLHHLQQKGIYKKSAPLGGDADSDSIVTCELVSNKCEASESGDLQILVLLSEPLGYSSLITVAELELLVNQAVLLQELLIIGIFS